MKLHKMGCMCDGCIKSRTKERVLAKLRNAEQEPYIDRRGGEIGSVSVAEALKALKARKVQ